MLRTFRSPLRIAALSQRGLGVRAPVVVLAVAIVVAMAFLVSRVAAVQIRDSATASALHNVEAIVRGYVDPSLTEESLSLEAIEDPAISDQVYRLTASGDIQAVHVWSRDGRAVYSSDPDVLGHRHSIGHDLSTAFSGRSFARYEAGHPDGRAPPGDHFTTHHLEIFVPIRGSVDGAPFGVYQVFQDATEIEGHVAQTERDVFVIALIASSVLLALLLLAFAGTSRLLSRQNALLRQRAATEEFLTADLRRSDERFRSLVRNVADVILVVRANGLVAYESPAVERVLGYRVDDRIGQDAFAMAHPDDRARAESLLSELQGTSGAEAVIELRARHADGSWRYLEGTAKNLLDDPAVGGIVINYRDATEHRALEEQLRHQAFHDPLTGLANRALLTERLEHGLATAARKQSGLAVVFLDLDDFKAINDSLGHSAGDLLLAEVGQRVKAGLRAGDTAARFGGDEFCLLLEDLASPTAAIDVAQRMLEALRAPFFLGERELHVHASIGIAMRTSTSQIADDLLRDADVAMYVAKRRGKDRLEVYEPAVHLATVTRLALLAELPKAIENGQFELEYQPVIDLRNGETTAVEALLRWRHPQRGVVRPEEFIPLSEENGMIVPLGRWVLREACRQVMVWDRVTRRRPLSVSVNVSSRQIEPAFAETVAAALRDSGLPASRLILEITESELLEDADVAQDVLFQLRDSGVRLAIDDFGTGYSSLDYLRRLPVDLLKIDRSFVALAAGEQSRTELLGSIIRLGGTLDMEMVAEGVETHAQVEVLRRFGVRYAQGYHYSVPLAPDAMTGYLRTLDGQSRVAASRGLRADPAPG